MNYLERNYKILEQKMIEQVEISLDYGKNLIDSELNAGVFNAVVKPIIKSFYKYWSDKDARTGTLGQIKVTLNSAKEFIQNGNDKKIEFERIINHYFPIYLENDQTDRQCKKNHQNYPKLKEITKKCFIAQVEESILFLNVNEEVSDYNELSRAAFKSKENAYKALKRQLDFNDQGIKVVEKDNSILKVPMGKNIILTVLRKGFELTKKQLIDDLDNIFH